MSANVQTIELASEKTLTPKQEAFARYYVECRNTTTAYRMAYDVDRSSGIEWIYTEAYRTLHLPHVAAHVAMLQEAASAHTIVKARELLQDLVDQASTDANDLVQLHTNNCRYCHGDGNRYQWVDDEELAEACGAVQEDIDRGVKRKMPDYRGGFGFKVRREPNPDCVKCEGRGSVVVRFANTDQLSPRARKLYKGAKMGANGTVELLMHDQQGARVEAAKILGMYGKDGATLNPAKGDIALPTDVTAEDASKAYLTMAST